MQVSQVLVGQVQETCSFSAVWISGAVLSEVGVDMINWFDRYEGGSGDESNVQGRGGGLCLHLPPSLALLHNFLSWSFWQVD